MKEKNKCNILLFDYQKAEREAYFIVRFNAGERRRKHPVYCFFDRNKQYICEVRYGDAGANALQRGLWSNTAAGLPYFDSITNGWIDYSHNKVLVQLFSHALVSSRQGHDLALEKIKNDITRLQDAKGQTQ